MPEAPGSHETCRLCGWRDDSVQLRWPDLSGGANEPSLIDAQRDVVISHEDADFDPEPFWRPIDGRDRFEPRGRQLALWPDDHTVLYWWRRRPGSAWWEEPQPALPTINEPSAAFHEAVRTVAAVVPAAEPDNLAGMAMDFDHYLWSNPTIRTVTVTSSPRTDPQLTARCVADRSSSPQRVAAELREVWLRSLRYRHWEAHLIRFTPTSVQLDVVTRSSGDAGGYYITGLIVASWAGGSTSA